MRLLTPRATRTDTLCPYTTLCRSLGAAVVEQVELGVAAAADKLVAALLLRPGLRHVAAHQRGIDRQEGAADVLGEGEVGLPVAALEVVVDDAADAARLAAVGAEEVFVAPLLEARQVVGVVAVAGGPPGARDGGGV